MSVQVRERVLAGGIITFDCDCYHDGQRISMKTGLRVDPTKKNAYKATRSEAHARAVEYESLLQKDPSAVFEKKQRNHKDFIEYCLVHARLRNNPPVWLNMIKHLKDYHGSDALPMARVSDIFGQRFRAYLAELEHLNNTSRKNYLATFKAAVRKAAKEGYIEDFAGKIENFKPAEPKRHFLTIEQIDALIEAECTRDSIKYAFLFSCYTGLRYSDVKKLCFSDIEVYNNRRYISYCQKKTGKHEYLPLNEQADSFLKKAAELHTKETAPSSKGPMDDNEAIGPNEADDWIFTIPCRATLGSTLHHWGENAGIPFHLHYHVSRHTYAALSIQGGVPIYNLSKMMGHSSVAMTEIYSHLIPEARIAAVDALPVPASFKTTSPTDHL